MPSSPWSINVLESEFIAAFQATPDGRFMRVNEGLARMLGYTSPAHFIKNVSSITDDLLFSATAASSILLLNQSTTENTSFECQWRTKDGTPIWLQIERRYILDCNGSVEFIEGLAVNITAMKENERKYRLLAENSLDVVFSMKADLSLQYVTPSVTRVLGYERNEFLKVPVTQMIDKQSWEMLLKARERRHLSEKKGVYSGGPREYKILAIHKLGWRLWCSLMVSTMRDEANTELGLLCVLRDIHAQVEAEQMLKSTLAEFEAIFDNSQTGVMLLSNGRRISRVNNRLAEIFGYTPQDLEGQSVRMLHSDQKSYEYFGMTFYPRLLKGQIRQQEYQLTHKNGHLVWCMLSGQAMDQNDLDKGVIWIIEDISRLKEAEELKQDVDRIMRHDLKVPLNGIINLPYIIEQEGNLSASQLEALQLIEDAGKRMLRTIGLSMDLYKMETGQYTVSAQRIDILGILRGVLREVRPLVQSKQIVLNITHDHKNEDGPIVAWGEGMLCNNILGNLLQNALEATPPGGSVNVRISRSTPSNDTVHISIQNPGSISTDFQRRFFDKYATQGKKGGTGLGTYSARLMARAQKGDITLHYDKSTGVTVTVILPTNDPEKNQPDGNPSDAL